MRQQWAKIIETALAEDLGWGDVTTESCIPPERLISGRYIAKDDLVVCGLEGLPVTFGQLDSTIQVALLCQDGDNMHKGDVLATVSGPARGILTGERTSLNLLQHLSGIATQTHQAVQSVQGLSRICDTRKTTPGLRVLEKYAVRTGGGTNHRLGLSDGVLIKDNHIAAAGSIGAAISHARGRIPHTLKIEVETTCLSQVKEALEAGADIIMLDNMGLDEMREAVVLVAGRALTEASGNMGDRSLLPVAQTGVDIISIGALTHSVKAADISLRFDT